MIAADIYPLEVYEKDRQDDLKTATYISLNSKREEVISNPQNKSVYVTYTPEFIIRYAFTPKGQLGSFIIYSDLNITDRR